MKIGKLDLTVTGENQKIVFITDGKIELDFRDESMMHPVNLFLTPNGIQITNTYAVCQHVNVGINDNIVEMLCAYLRAPAASYRHIHILGCKASIMAMRKVLATYVTHIGRNVSPDEYKTTLEYLRVLTALGDKHIADMFTDAINSSDQSTAFTDVMTPLMKQDVMVSKYISLLELYYGYIKHQLVDAATILTCPMDSVESREPADNVDAWALSHNLIDSSQSIQTNQAKV